MDHDEKATKTFTVRGWRRYSGVLTHTHTHVLSSDTTEHRSHSALHHVNAEGVVVVAPTPLRRAHRMLWTRTRLGRKTSDHRYASLHFTHTPSSNRKDTGNWLWWCSLQEPRPWHAPRVVHRLRWVVVGGVRSRVAVGRGERGQRHRALDGCWCCWRERERGDREGESVDCRLRSFTNVNELW